MHPISNNNFGPNGIAVLLNNGAGPVPGFMVQQLGNVRFVVSDGTVKSVCRLAQTVAQVSPLASGYFTVPVSRPGSGSGATFSATYGVDAAFVGTSGGGTGYAVGDTVTFPHGAVLLVAAASTQGAVTSFTLQTPGSFTQSNLSSGATNVGAVATSGAGTGATAALEFSVSAVASSGGTKYAVGTPLLFNGIVTAPGGSQPLVSISQVDANGMPLAFSFTFAGNLITTPATSITTPSAITEHAIKLDSTRLETAEGHMYRWSLTPDPSGLATGTLAVVLS